MTKLGKILSAFHYVIKLVRHFSFYRSFNKVNLLNLNLITIKTKKPVVYYNDGFSIFFNKSVT